MSAVAQPPAVRLAVAVVEELIAAGVRDVVLSPGSRNTPLALVLAAAEAQGRLGLHVRLDERGAAFVAVGLAKVNGRPVAVLTTSGTAAINLHPGLAEAAHSGLPVIAITADRPATMINNGSNQATRQPGLFGTSVRAEAQLNSADEAEDAWRFEVRRCVAAASGVRSRRPGPVHLNLALAAPLVPTADVVLGVSPGTGMQPAPPWPREELDHEPGTVVLAGDGAGPAARELAEASRLPLLAEPSSGSRSGPNAVARYRLLLAGALGGAVRRVLCFGRPTLSRPVTTLLGRVEKLIMVSPQADWVDPGWRVARVLGAAPRLPVDRGGWLHAWLQADRDLASEVDAAIGDWSGPRIAEVVMREVPSRGPLVLGSSNPIRDCDLAPIAGPGVVFANRGLAGIDGTLSTALGVALGSERPTHALVGDLTFLHDLTGLLQGRHERRVDLRIVVADDSGGSIFASLEQGAAEHAEHFERIFATPQQVDLQPLCAGLGARYRRVQDEAALAAALAVPPSGTEVLHCPIGRSERRALGERLTRLAAG